MNLVHLGDPKNGFQKTLLPDNRLIGTRFLRHTGTGRQEWVGTSLIDSNREISLYSGDTTSGSPWKDDRDEHGQVDRRRSTETRPKSDTGHGSGYSLDW